VQSQNLVSHPTENTFAKFGFLVIYHTSFFIFVTTIGLNIIFGIIVDTFSELRNLKARANETVPKIYYTMFTRLTRKAGLDICPLPADVRDSCFRGGAGAREGKCRRLSVSSSSSGGGRCVCL